MQGFGHAHPGQPPEPYFPLGPERLGRLHHLAQHVFNAKSPPGQVALRSNPVVELYQVHLLPAHSGKAGINRGYDASFDIGVVIGGQAVFCPNVDLGVQFVQNPAKVGFRLAVTVLRSGVKVVDAQLHGAGHRLDLVTMLSPYHKSAHVAAAKPNLRHL